MNSLSFKTLEKGLVESRYRLPTVFLFNAHLGVYDAKVLRDIVLSLRKLETREGDKSPPRQVFTVRGSKEDVVPVDKERKLVDLTSNMLQVHSSRYRKRSNQECKVNQA
jgi:hypothetical protein